MQQASSPCPVRLVVVQLVVVQVLPMLFCEPDGQRALACPASVCLQNRRNRRNHSVERLTTAHSREGQPPLPSHVYTSPANGLATTGNHGGTHTADCVNKASCLPSVNVASRVIWPASTECLPQLCTGGKGPRRRGAMRHPCLFCRHWHAPLRSTSVIVINLCVSVPNMTELQAHALVRTRPRRVTVKCAVLFVMCIDCVDPDIPST